VGTKAAGEADDGDTVLLLGQAPDKIAGAVAGAVINKDKLEVAGRVADAELAKSGEEPGDVVDLVERGDDDRDEGRGLVCTVGTHGR